ncbi:DUF222 domain-containing protein [Microbacterium sp.]|uniref:HNH endonuclease signature motif containing protein n=1 Tax=Microbacterium sp. TaxID=51671 RepID=UPI00281175E8|nr:DUF222 domain-containing protein [Microbacterium sp.]
MSEDVLPHFERRATLLDEWVEARRQAAAWEAKAAGLLAQRAELLEHDIAEAPLHRESIWRSMVAEYSAAGRMAKGAVEHAFADARVLATDLPGLRASFEAGLISPAHVREVIRAAFPVTQAIADGALEPAALALYEAAAVEFAETEAPARTRAHVREIAAALAGQTVLDRHRAAESERCVSVRSVGDGLALLQAVLPEHLAEGIMDRLTQLARHQKSHVEDREPTFAHIDSTSEGSADDASCAHDAIFGIADTFTVDPFAPYEPPHARNWLPEPVPADDTQCAESHWASIDRALAAGPQIVHLPGDARTIDQIRADLLTDLLLGSEPSEVQGAGLENITARVQVTVAATTLADVDDDPAQLDGHGALHPDIARALAGRNTGWTRLFLDPHGLVTETDTYAPTEPMRRFLRARDEHCRFPGCRMPVHRCDIDHNHDHALGGPTALCNLAHFCRAHHVLKHPDIPEAHRWTARQLPDWTIEWTSPLGRTYPDKPPRRVMFVPSRPPARDESVWAETDIAVDVALKAPF